VSWYDAVDFCNKLSEREQRPPYYRRNAETVVVLGGEGYRLPREAEWEYACRAGATTRWTFGEDQQDLTQSAWISSNSGGRTQRVGELPANPFGLYDLYGNVWEWCWDWHGEYTARAVSDPTGAAAGSGRVLRGGAFDFHASYCRSAFRNDYHPMYRSLSYGFRVCCGR
jgi:formylglycine-generating enzyme required for sulfatase activity